MPTTRSMASPELAPAAEPTPEPAPEPTPAESAPEPTPETDTETDAEAEIKVEKKGKYVKGSGKTGRVNKRRGLLERLSFANLKDAFIDSLSNGFIVVALSFLVCSLLFFVQPFFFRYMVENCYTNLLHRSSEWCKTLMVLDEGLFNIFEGLMSLCSIIVDFFFDNVLGAFRSMAETFKKNDR